MRGRSRRKFDGADQRFPARIKIAVPPTGLGERLNQMFAWLDANCGADGWDQAPAGTGLVNDALAIYFRNPLFVSAFAARWCVAAEPLSEGALLQVREDAPAERGPGPGHFNPWRQSKPLAD